MNRFTPPLLALLALGCAHAPARASSPPRGVRLLSETAELETSRRAERREDLEVETTDFDRTPRVVATGETALLSTDGQDARLYGDEAGTAGFSVDNCVLLEVVGADGRVLRQVVIGSVPGLSQGRNRIDSLGPSAFSFGPGELRLTPLLPESGLFRLRATALDYGGAGRVSDVFVRFASSDGSGDDAREP
jgi:hypothetical protein